MVQSSELDWGNPDISGQKLFSMKLHLAFLSHNKKFSNLKMLLGGSYLVDSEAAARVSGAAETVDYFG